MDDPTLLASLLAGGRFQPVHCVCSGYASVRVHDEDDRLASGRDQGFQRRANDGRVLQVRRHRIAGALQLHRLGGVGQLLELGADGVPA